MQEYLYRCVTISSELSERVYVVTNLLRAPDAQPSTSQASVLAVLVSDDNTERQEALDRLTVKLAAQPQPAHYC